MSVKAKMLKFSLKRLDRLVQAQLELNYLAESLKGVPSIAAVLEMLASICRFAFVRITVRVLTKVAPLKAAHQEFLLRFGSLMHE